MIPVLSPTIISIGQILFTCFVRLFPAFDAN